MTPYLSLSSSSFLTSISCRKLHGILLASYPHITSFDRLRTGIPTKDKIMAEALQGVYRPRRPQTTSFYQLVEDHGERLKNVYPDRYERQFGYYRPITEKVFFKYLDCGILRQGFARIRCDQCHYEYLLAFSCKTRSFCPSCHAKRYAVFSEWVCDEVLEPVTHRHYVFSIPKILRIFFASLNASTAFRYNRKLLGGLSRCASETARKMMQAAMGDSFVSSLTGVHRRI